MFTIAGGILLAFFYLALGCIALGGLIFAGRTLWILLVPNSDHRKAREYARKRGSY